MQKVARTLVFLFSWLILIPEIRAQKEPVSVYQDVRILVKSSEILRNHEATEKGVRVVFDLPALKNLFESRANHFAFQLPRPDGGGNWTLQMERRDILSQDFRVKTSDGKEITGGQILSEQAFFHGTLKDIPGSRVALTLSRRGLEGAILDGKQNYDLGHEKNSPEDVFVVYETGKVFRKLNFTCAAGEGGQPSTQAVTGPFGCTRQFRNYLECDFRMYQDFGSNVTSVTNFITSAFNVVALLYDNENLAAVLSEVFVWTSNDPFSANTTSLAYVEQYRTTRTTFNGDLCHLLTTRPLGLGGIAYVDILCHPSVRHAFSNIETTFSNFPVYSWTATVITHEIGHNLGSPHTQSCTWPGGALDNCYPTEEGCPPGPAPVNGGTIMSYCHLASSGINLSNGFGTLPGNLIRKRVAEASCLSNSPGSTPMAAACLPTVTTPLSGGNIGALQFTLNTINARTRGSAFSNYEDLTCSIGTTLVAGSTYSLSISTETNPQNVRIYIDFNGDNSFDASELVFSANGSTAPQVFTGSITIPAGVTQNVYRRLRVVSDFVSNANPLPCGVLNFGQAEDYRVMFTNGSLTAGTLAAANQGFCSAPADPAVISFSTLPSPGSDFQWFKREGLVAAPAAGDPVGTWEIILGQNSPTYDPPAGLSANRTYACRVSNGVSTQWASGVRQISFLSPVTFGSLSVSNQTFLGSGDPSLISFATVPAGGSGTFTYQWYSAAGIQPAPTGTTIPAAWTVVAGATSASYDPPVQSASISYAVRVDAAGLPDCAPATWASGVRQITVNPFSPGTVAAGNQSLCNPADPSAISLSAAPTAGSTLQWYFQTGIISAPPASDPVTSWTIIPGATSSTYDPPAGLTQSQTFACRATNGTNSQWAAGVRQITVAPLVVYGTLTGGNESFVTSGNPAIISFLTAPSGGAGTFTYQWYSAAGIQAAPTGTAIPAGWTAIAGATSANYDPPVQSSSVSFAVQVNPTGTPDCGNATWATGVRQITVSAFTPGTLALSNQTLCNPADPTGIVFSAAASPGSTYQWYSQNGIVAAPAATDGVGLWTSIAAATGSSYDPPAGLTSSRTYACRVTNGAITQWASGVRQITVLAPVVFGTLASGNQSFVTSGNPGIISFSTAPSGGSGSFTYQWYYTSGIQSAPTGTSVPLAWIAIAGATSASYDPPVQSASISYAVQVNPAGSPDCALATWASGVRQITVTPFQPGVVASGNQTLCNPADPANITLSTAAAAGSTFQWFFQAGIVAAPAAAAGTAGWTSIAGATASSYDPPAGLTASRTYACRVTNGGTGLWSSGVRQVTVLAAVTYGTLASGNQVFTGSGDPSVITLSTSPSGGAGTFTYQWYSRPGIQAAPTGTAIPAGWTAIAGATATSYDPPVQSASISFALQVNPTGSPDCAVATWASGVRQITVNPLAGALPSVTRPGQKEADSGQPAANGTANGLLPSFNGSFLGTASPNPWDTRTEIELELPENQNTGRLLVRSLEGKVVYSGEVSGPGRQFHTLHRSDWPAGIYFYSLEAGGLNLGTGKMVLIR